MTLKELEAQLKYLRQEECINDDTEVIFDSDLDVGIKVEHAYSFSRGNDKKVLLLAGETTHKL